MIPLAWEGAPHQSSTRFSERTTFPKRGITLWRSLSLNLGRIQHSLAPSGQLVSWSRVVNYLKKFLHARMLHVVNERRLTRDEQFRFWPRQHVVATRQPCWKNIQEFRRKTAHRRNLRRRDQSLRYRLGRWHPLQANALKLTSCIVYTISL